MHLVLKYDIARMDKTIILKDNRNIIATVKCFFNFEHELRNLLRNSLYVG